MEVVRGYHVYKDVWELYLGGDFTTKHQRNNPHDKYAALVFFCTNTCKIVSNARHLTLLRLLARGKVAIV